MPGVRATYRNKIKTPAKVVGRMILDLIRAEKFKAVRFEVNAYSGSSVTPVVPTGPSSSAWTSTPANQHTEIILTEIDDEAGDYNVEIVARKPNGNPFSVSPSHQDGVNGEIYWTWYKDAVTDYLTVRIWNGREGLEMKAWY